MRTMTLLMLGLLPTGCGDGGPFEDMFGGEPDVFEGVDLDRDGTVAHEEFGGWIEEEGILDAWDTDDEAGYSVGEVTSALVDLWDGGEAGLTMAELREGVAAWFPDIDLGLLGEWDLDDDDIIDDDEAETGIERAGLLTGWGDPGEGYDEDTVVGHLYEIFDEDGDTLVTRQEWEQAVERLGL